MCSSDLITIDLTTPSTTIVYPQNITYSINVSNLNYTYTETNPTCKYSTDGGATNSSSVTCGINFTNVISTEGSNTWTLYTNDSQGNKNSTSITFWKDTVNPNINFTDPTPSNATTQPNTDVFVNVSMSDTSDHSAFIDWDRSLKVWLKMDEYNASGVFDNSTYNNFAMFDEMTSSGITAGIRGDALDFDGITDDHLMFMSGLVADITGNITATAWIKADSLTNNDSFLMKTSNDSWVDEIGRAS